MMKREQEKHWQSLTRTRHTVSAHLNTTRVLSRLSQTNQDQRSLAT